uniref:SEA domain-containing protein n=1 Tax=Panagrellus redivivus TaxID=6233 RepID=A0A7E4ZVY3_PANRE
MKWLVPFVVILLFDISHGESSKSIKEYLRSNTFASSLLAPYEAQGQICPSQPFHETMSFRLRIYDQLVPYIFFEKLLLSVFGTNRLDKTKATTNIFEIAKTVKVTSARCGYDGARHFEVTVALPGNYANLSKYHNTHDALKELGYNMTAILETHFLHISSIKLMEKDDTPSIFEEMQYISEPEIMEETKFDYVEEHLLSKYFFIGVTLLILVVALTVGCKSCIEYAQEYVPYQTM